MGKDDRVPGERGLGLVGLLVSLAVLGVVAAVSVVALGSGGGVPTVTVPKDGAGGAGASSASGSIGAVALAADEAAQENLRAALDALAQVAAVDGYSAVTASGLQGSLRGVTFIGGPSTSASVISLTSVAGSSGGVGMAALSSSGTCWETWTAGAATYFGAELKAATCSAPALASAPAPAPPATGRVGWQAGSFPAG